MTTDGMRNNTAMVPNLGAHQGGSEVPHKLVNVMVDGFASGIQLKIISLFN